MGDSFHGDLLGGGRHGRRWWSRKASSCNLHQGSQRLLGGGRPFPRSSLVREGTSFAKTVSPSIEQLSTEEP